MNVIGLTGGIASGKSTVSARLREVHGFAIVDADQVARFVVEPGQPALAEIEAHFGDRVIAADGTLDRATLATIVFGDEDQRQALNAITHPRIAEEMSRRIAGLADHPGPVVVDSPLLIEMGHTDAYPVIVVVASAPEVQHRRLVEERGMDADEAWARINSQASLAEKRAVASHVLENDGSLADLHAQIDELATTLRR